MDGVHGPAPPHPPWALPGRTPPGPRPDPRRGRRPAPDHGPGEPGNGPGRDRTGRRAGPRPVAGSAPGRPRLGPRNWCRADWPPWARAGRVRVGPDGPGVGPRAGPGRSQDRTPGRSRPGPGRWCRADRPPAPGRRGRAGPRAAGPGGAGAGHVLPVGFGSRNHPVLNRPFLTNSLTKQAPPCRHHLAERALSFRSGGLRLGPPPG